MEIKIWWIWMAIAAFFVIAEIFTMGFFLLWFGVGAFAAGILALMGLAMGWQLGAFVVVSLILFVDLLRTQKTKLSLSFDISRMGIIETNQVIVRKLP